MKTDCRLDYSTILANQGRPVHLAVSLTAGAAAAEARRALAFCVVLDRSGSMAGAPLRNARLACETVIRNLRPADGFALVAFDDRAEVVIPLQPVTDKAGAIAAVRGIADRGSTNLTAGWMLGRDELAKTDGDTTRRILLLSDGQLNVGIVEPDEVARIVCDGLERGRIRTSTLGFGEQYDEALLERLATSSGGQFHDANSPDKLPAIFAAELDGLQKIASQNVRLRLRSLDFCESWRLLAAYPSVPLPDGRTEIAMGDLVSEESATAVFQLDVLPLPWLDDGRPAASLEGEPLVELEILWDDLTGGEVRSCSRVQTIRVLATQDPADVTVNVDVIPGVVTQQAGFAMSEALRQLDERRPDEALELLRATVRRLEALGSAAATAENLAVLKRMIDMVEGTGELDLRSSKSFRYSATHRRKMKTKSHWSSDDAAPDYSQPSPPPPSAPEPDEDPDGAGEAGRA
jgi:Ca-activated chloride channel family protein